MVLSLRAERNSSSRRLDHGPYSDGQLGRSLLKLNGLLQGRYTLDLPAQGELSQTFDLALARLAFSGTAFTPEISYFFQLSASSLGNTNSVSLVDGWVQYALAPQANIKTGRFIVPYSREFNTNPGNLLFSGLSAADEAFDLPRATGVAISGSISSIPTVT